MVKQTGVRGGDQFFRVAAASNPACSGPTLSWPPRLALFGRLSAGQRLPAWEQIATRQDRVRQAAALIVKAITILAAALSLLLNAVRALVAAVLIGSRARR